MPASRASPASHTRKQAWQSREVHRACLRSTPQQPPQQKAPGDKHAPRCKMQRGQRAEQAAVGGHRPAVGERARRLREARARAGQALQQARARRQARLAAAAGAAAGRVAAVLPHRAVGRGRRAGAAVLHAELVAGCAAVHICRALQRDQLCAARPRRQHGVLQRRKAQPCAAPRRLAARQLQPRGGQGRLQVCGACGRGAGWHLSRHRRGGLGRGGWARSACSGERGQGRGRRGPHTSRASAGRSARASRQSQFLSQVCRSHVCRLCNRCASSAPTSQNAAGQRAAAVQSASHPAAARMQQARLPRQMQKRLPQQAQVHGAGTLPMQKKSVLLLEDMPGMLHENSRRRCAQYTKPCLITGNGAHTCFDVFCEAGRPCIELLCTSCPPWPKRCSRGDQSGPPASRVGVQLGQ